MNTASSAGARTRPAGSVAGDLTIRRDVRPDDPEAIRRIVASTGFFRPGEVDVAVELAQERLARGDASGYHFVFLDDPSAGGRAVGYVCVGPIPCTVDSFDLYWIAVDAGCQGRGLGRRLMAEGEALIRALGGKRVYIETSGLPLYEPTRRFYLASGYVEQARLPDFYTRGDDKVIYCRVLD